MRSGLVLKGAALKSLTQGLHRHVTLIPPERAFPHCSDAPTSFKELAPRAAVALDIVVERSRRTRRCARTRWSITWNGATRGPTRRWRGCFCFCRDVTLVREGGAATDAPMTAYISYDEKPDIQAIGTTAPDLAPVPGHHPAVGRDHEYVRHGTVTLMAGMDLVTGHVHRARRGAPSGSSGPRNMQSRPAGVPPAGSCQHPLAVRDGLT